MGSGLSKTCGGIPETMKLDEAHVTAEVERLSVIQHKFVFFVSKRWTDIDSYLIPGREGRAEGP